MVNSAGPGKKAQSLVELRDELSPVDYLMHRGESRPSHRSAFLGIEILDRRADWERLHEAIDRASRVVLRMRQKVVVPTVPTTAPRWVVDPDFDLSYHLRRVALPEPGTMRQLLDLAEVSLQAPLDTSRALWEATYVEGLEGDRSALLLKFSHAVTDGLGGIALFEQVYDTVREPAARPMPLVPAPRDVSGGDLVRQSLRQLPGSLVSGTRTVLSAVVGTGARLVQDPESAARDVAGFAASARRIIGPPSARSPLLRRRSLMSRTEVLDVPLADLRAAAKAGGGSINDAYLAALCGALGHYHRALGVPVHALPLAIPVSLRTSTDPAAGNRIAGLTISAPLSETDPAECMRRIREQVVTGRGEPAIDVLARIAPVLSVLPGAALDALSDRITPPDIQASNVPGYPGDTFLAGARVERQYGMGPLPGVAMMAVLVSRAGTCSLAVRYDTTSFTDNELLVNCLRQGFADVLALGSDAATPSRAAVISAVRDPS
jgi:diacylglycerol O-acyltransferase